MSAPLCDLPKIEYLDGVAHPKVSLKVSHSLVQGAVIRVLQDLGRERGFVLPELRVDPGRGKTKRTGFVRDVAFIGKDPRRANLYGFSTLE